MNYYQISEYINKNYLRPLESFELNNLADFQTFHDELIKINVELIAKGFPVMPHYRGEQNYGWDILPGIYRPPFSNEIDLSKAREIEKNGAEIFKKRVTEKYGENQLFKHSKEPYGKDWDLLFQAQHAGVKTNLIDLSTSSLSSAYFLSEPSDKHENSDGQFWGLLVPQDFIFNETSDYEKSLYPNFNPYELDTSFVCNVPTYIDDIDQRTYQFRLFRQHGRPFASSNSDVNIPLNKKDFWKNMIVRVKVKAKKKETIYDELKARGIDKERLILSQNDDVAEFIEGINNEMKKL